MHCIAIKYQKYMLFDILYFNFQKNLYIIEIKSKSQHFTIKLNYSSPIFCQNCDMRLNDTYFDFSFHGYKIKEKPIKRSI